MAAEKPPGLLTVPRFEKIPFLIHGFGDFHWTEDDFDKVEGWRRFHPLVLMQVHSDVVHVVDAAMTIRGPGMQGDGLITAEPLLFLVIRTADCLPVLLADEKRRVIAAVHCGWRSTAKKILERAVHLMCSRFGADPANLLAAFGPCIGADCYEVGEDVRSEFAARNFPAGIFRHHPVHAGKYFLDLREANRGLLLRLGFSSDNIFSVDACTHCDGRFLSYRRDRDKSARMLSFIGITD